MSSIIQINLQRTNDQQHTNTMNENTVSYKMFLPCTGKQNIKVVFKVLFSSQDSLAGVRLNAACGNEIVC